MNSRWGKLFASVEEQKLHKAKITAYTLLQLPVGIIKIVFHVQYLHVNIPVHALVLFSRGLEWTEIKLPVLFVPSIISHDQPGI